MTFLIFILGLVTVLLSIVVACQFVIRYFRFPRGHPKKLSLALALQLIGESIIGAGTLIFAWAAHYGHLEYWTVEFQSFIRFSMFFATAATTIHLYRTVKG